MIALTSSFQAVIHIIDAGIPSEKKSAIESLAARLGGHSVRFIEPDVDLFSGIQTTSYHISAYYRLALPELLEIDRVIYLDADLLVFDCLGKLWIETERIAEPITAVQDWETQDVSDDSPAAARMLGVSDVVGYFNSGMMVLNLAALRKELFTERACELLQKHGHHVRFADQTALNILSAGRWHPLSPKWNTPSWAFDLQDENSLPKVLHFTNNAPWLRRRFCPSQALFERIALDLALRVPQPEVSSFRFSLQSLLRWWVAPIRVFYQIFRALTSWSLKDRNCFSERLAISQYWWRYFWEGPFRVSRYWQRIRAIRAKSINWHSKFPI